MSRLKPTIPVPPNSTTITRRDKYFDGIVFGLNYTPRTYYNLLSVVSVGAVVGGTVGDTGGDDVAVMA